MAQRMKKVNHYTQPLDHQINLISIILNMLFDHSDNKVYQIHAFYYLTNYLDIDFLIYIQIILDHYAYHSFYTQHILSLFNIIKQHIHHYYDHLFSYHLLLLHVFRLDYYHLL